MGSQVAQLRERLSELDRAVTALTNAGAGPGQGAIVCVVGVGLGSVAGGARLQTSHV